MANAKDYAVVGLVTLATLAYLIAIGTAGCGLFPTTAREQQSGGTNVEAPTQQTNMNNPPPPTPPGAAGGTSIQLSDAATVTGLLAAIAAGILALQAKTKVNGIANKGSQ